MENINIRLIILEDCSKLSKLKREVWETTYRGIYPDEKLDNYDYVRNKKVFETYVNNESKYLYVALDKEDIIGYIEFGAPNRAFEDFKQEIGLFYIKKEYQNKGIGKKLFKLAYDKIFITGVNKFFISCSKYNKNAIGFYTNMGGKIIHTDIDDIDNPQVKFEYIKNM